MGMETVRRLRAMASLCRQSAAYRPDRGWKLLAEAEYWEHLANAALPEHFKDCTSNLNSQTQPNPLQTMQDDCWSPKYMRTAGLRGWSVGKDDGFAD
jgi:hypothetical protein